MEVKIPLKLRDFQVVSDNTNKEEVIKDLKEILDFIYKEEEMLFSSSDRFFSMCNYMRNNKKQQSNSMGRYMELNTSVDYPYQNYNINSAFRSIAIDKAYGYIQSANLFRILNDFNTKDVKEIRKIYRSRHITKVPTKQVVEAHIHRFYNKGNVVASRPGPAREFNLSQTDMFYCTKTEVVDNNIFITVKLSKGETTLKFRIPKYERFTDNVKKYSRPNVVLEDDNLIFIFTVFKDVEEKEYKNIMGVDIGKIESFVATVVYTDEKEYSAPFFSTKNINILTKRINGLFEEINRLDKKIEINEKCNHPEKVEVLKEEKEIKRIQYDEDSNNYNEQTISKKDYKGFDEVYDSKSKRIKGVNKSVYLDKDRELLTLQTCIPIFINSQRLLVTGERIPYDGVDIKENTDIRLVNIAFLIVLLLILFLIIKLPFNIINNIKYKKIKNTRLDKKEN